MASRARQAKQPAYESNLDRAKDALRFISPDLPNDEWVKVGMALQSEFGDSGFQMFDDWSRGWAKYDERDIRTRWKGFDQGGGITIGTLYGMAKDAGWKPSRDESKPLLPLQPDPERIERQQQAKLESEQKQATAAGIATAVYTMAKACKTHGYLTAKGVQPVNGLRVIDADEAHRLDAHFGFRNGKQSGELLIFPIHNELGEIQSLQAITAKASKGLLKDGKKSEGFFVIDEKGDNGTVYVVEGLATGLSVHEATAARVHVAIDAGNLEAVAESARRRFPEARIVIAGDLDKNHTGQKKGRAAAAAVNGLAIFPDFAAVEGRELGDWNDLHAAAGIDEVKRQIDAALTQPAAPASDPVEGSSTDKPTKGEATPKHFNVTSEYVEYINSEGFPTRVCGALRVLARVRNEADFGYGLHVEFKTLAGHTRRLVVHESLLEQPQELRKKLADAGLWLNRAHNKVKGWLIAYLSESTPPTMALSIERAGWHQGMTAYVYPGGEILHNGSTPPALVWSNDPPDPSRHGQRGTLEQFQQHQGRYCVGNPVLMFGVCVAFGAKILAFVQGEGGTFHIWGEPGKGKTTGQYLMVSVDAPPGAKGSWEGTQTSYGQRMAASNDSASALDEIKMADEKHLDKISYLIANGHDKSRSKEGLGLAREATWRVYVLSSGEMAFLRYLGDHAARVYGGQEVRFLDLKVDDRAHGVFDELHGFPTGVAFAEEIERVCGLYYGTAGREFVRRLMASYTPERIKAFAAEIRKDFELHIPEHSDTAIYRAAKKFAHVAVGGELAVELGIVPWKKFDALQAALDMFDLWIQGRGGIGNRDRMDALKQIRHYLLTHEEDQFTRNCPKCQGSGKPGMVKLGFDRSADEPEFVTCSACAGTAVQMTKTLNKAGWVKRERQEDGDTAKMFHVYPEVFEKDIARGHDTRTVLELLKARKILQADGKRGPFKTKARPLHELGAPFERPVDVYVVNLDSPGWETS